MKTDSKKSMPLITAYRRSIYADEKAKYGVCSDCSAAVEMYDKLAAMYFQLESKYTALCAGVADEFGKDKLKQIKDAPNTFRQYADILGRMLAEYSADNASYQGSESR